MNPWLQSKQYICPRCGTVYLHDKGYLHDCFECPARPVETKRKVEFVGKTYEQKVGQ